MRAPSAATCQRLIDAVQRFCRLAESRRFRRPETLALRYCEALGELYTAVTADLYADASAAHYWAGSEWSDDVSLAFWRSAKPVEDGVSRVLGDTDVYWEYFDPYDEDSGLSTTVSNDIREVYRDIRPGLDLIASGVPDAVTRAVMAWRADFMIHWGNHLTDALRVLHRVAHRVQ